MTGLIIVALVVTIIPTAALIYTILCIFANEEQEQKLLNIVVAAYDKLKRWWGK